MPSIARTRPHTPNVAPRLWVAAFAVLQILTPLMPGLGVGQPIGSWSDSARTLITPAGWTFSIWGVLYAGSLAFAIFQLLPAQTENRRIARLRWPAAGAFSGNALWAAYTQMAGLGAISVLIIAGTLACLLTAYRRLTEWEAEYTRAEQWFAAVPLSALTAWLTAATIVNIAATLRFYGVDAGPTAPVLAALVIVAGGAIAGAALSRSRGNPAFALVFLWALSGIAAAGGRDSSLVLGGTLLAALLVVGGVVFGMRKGGLARRL